MKYDIILCGIGGHGIVSLGAIIAAGAVKDGLHIKQVDIHGMAQRGGSVISHLRLADTPIASDQISKGSASLILGTEPLESLRYAPFADPENGMCITSISPVENIDNYPDIKSITAQLLEAARTIIIDGNECMRQAGSQHVLNIIMLGAASVFIPLSETTMKRCIEERFAHKSKQTQQLNLRAFKIGRSQCDDYIRKSL